jgi:excisionase family DNA binding protein
MECVMNPAVVVSIPEACAIARIGKTRLYELINSGELPARKMGNRTLIIHSDLVKYLQSLPPVTVKQASDKGEREAVSGRPCRQKAGMTGRRRLADLSGEQQDHLATT